MPRITLQTLADRLHVSRTTVSNAWSKPDQLSPQLRERILALADELGYAGPDPVARSLRRGQVGAIGLLLTESLSYAFSDPYATPLLRGIATAIDDAGTSLLLVPLPPGAEVGQALQQAAVDGVIAWSLPEGHAALDHVRHRGLPLVTIDAPRYPEVPFVGIDDRRAMRELTTLALEHHHEQVLVLTFRVRGDDAEGPASRDRVARATYRLSAERIGGALEALSDRGVPDDAIEIREVRRNHRDHAERQVRAALAGDSPPSLVIATSDELALGALAAARGAGVAVPGRLAVTGFDDLPFAADAGLTTVAQPVEEKGARAVAHLLGREASGEELLGWSVVARGTHRPPDTFT